MSNGSIATVVEDPKGDSGNVLEVGSPDNKAKNSYPVINITLPDGLKLGDLTNIVFDIYLVDETSSKKNLVLILNGVRKNFTGDTPAKRGCPVGDWARKIIEFNVADVELSDADRDLSTFTLSLGPNIVNSYYYIDNITANWQTGEPDKYVDKTDAEKAQALADNFDTWVNSMMKVSAPNVNEYVVVSYPMSDDDAYMQRNADNETDLGHDTTSTFFFNDYMGDNYIVSFTNSIKKAYSANGGVNKLKLYVKESDLLGNSGKINRLLKQISDWTSAGAQIDGIAVELPLVYSENTTEQAANEAAVAALFKTLGTTGKLIRLDNVSMSNANADYYKYVIKQYCANIPSDKRGGIIFAGTGDLWKDATRTLNYEAVIEGLK